jgi:hypothetical protein
MNAKDVLEDIRFVLDEKSYRVGTVRKWASGEFQKTKQGWVPVATGKAAAKREPAAPAPIPKGKMPGGVGGMVAKAQKAVAAMFPDKEPEAPGDAAAAGKEPEKAPKEKPAAKEKPEPKSGFYEPNPTSDKDGDGVADAARVGVPAFDVPPPPGIPRLPNLNEKEREMETKFADAVEQDPEAAVNSFYEAAKKSNFVFETDAAKNLMPEWTRPDLPPDDKNAPVHPERAAVRALYNTALHQTANAVAKKAFLKRLDEIEKMDKNDPKRRVLVTSGGCAAGKGLSLAADPSLAANASATWDAAGEQNATENPWVLEECEKRGIPATFLFVVNDPKETIKSAVSRAAKIGRMVDTKVFADSYALGAKNFEAFRQKHKGRADFIVNRAPPPPPPGEKIGKPTALDSVPADALELTSEEIDKHAQEHLASQKGKIPDYVIQGATAGNRIWGKKGAKAEALMREAKSDEGPRGGEMDHRMPPAEKKKLADQFLKALEKGLSAPDKYYGDRTKDVQPLKGLEGELVQLPPEVQQMVQAELEKRTKGAKGKGSKGKDVLADLERVLSDIKDMIGKSKK